VRGPAEVAGGEAAAGVRALGEGGEQLRDAGEGAAAVDLTQGGFEAALGDPALPGDRSEVTRLVLCTGKVYYDVITDDRRRAARTVAVGRVELLYPFPGLELSELFKRYRNLAEVMWVQEEPRNMGARKFVLPQIRELLPASVAITDASRPERSSPAEGYPAAHQAEQARIVAAAFA